jgi:6-phosphogluconate dehydrogenase
VGALVTKEIGIVGLGRIGWGMTRRLVRSGIGVAGFDSDAVARSRAEVGGAKVADSLDGLVDQISRPRVLWLVLPAGAPVAATVSSLASLLDTDDLVVDGGNSDYRCSIEHAAELGKSGIRFLDVGTSGGIHGESTGFCLMVGGDETLVERVRPVLEALAPGPTRGWGRVGATGSGHFAKMIHNGIEYGLMQAYAEGFAMLDAKSDLELDPACIAEIWKDGSIIRSWLLELVAESLAEPDELARIAPYVPDSGEGRWAVREAIDLGVPAPVITASLIQRLRSRSEGGFAERLLAALRQQFGGHAVTAAREGE